MKVYCRDCKFLKEVHHEKKPTVYKCESPKNVKAEDTPLGRKETLVSTPEKINKDNDCPWFGASRPKTIREEPGPTVGMRTILDHEKRLVAIENKIFRKKETKDGKVSKSGTTDPSGPREPDSGAGGKEEAGKEKS